MQYIHYIIDINNIQHIFATYSHIYIYTNTYIYIYATCIQHIYILYIHRSYNIYCMFQVTHFESKSNLDFCQVVLWTLGADDSDGLPQLFHRTRLSHRSLGGDFFDANDVKL